MTISHTYKLADYPKETILRDGTHVVLKPMTREDASVLLQFFLGIPGK